MLTGSGADSSGNEAIGSGTTTGAGYVIRTARPPDAAAVRAIDDACFPPDDPDHEPAPPGELEDAVGVGDIRILEIDSAPLAYLHADRSRLDRIYISGVGVAPAWQQRGLGSRLIDDCLSALDRALVARLPIVTITSPRNLVMLRMIFARGFRARWILRDYFGPGRDRLGCQLSATGFLAPPSQQRCVPVHALDIVYSLVEHERRVIQGVKTTPSGSVFHLAAHPEHHFPAATPP